MKLRYPRIMRTIWAAILLVAILAVPAGADSQSGDLGSGTASGLARRSQQYATPIATVTTAEGSHSDPAASSFNTAPGSDSGDAIRQRVFSTAISGAAIALSALLLLWVYVTLRDPIRRHRASMRIRQFRREERKDRARRRQRQ